MDEDEALPDHLRCSRTDGKKWRCKRRVKNDLKLCEIHYLQGRHRQHRERVPESLKIQRKPKKTVNRENKEQNLNTIKITAKAVETLTNLKRNKRSEETVRKVKRVKRNDMPLELIRMVLKKEVEKTTKMKKKKKKKNKKVVVKENCEVEGVLTRELPNGLMEISSSSSASSRHCSVNGGSNSTSNIKVGIDLGGVTQRRFRSKNIEPMPIGTLQVLPYARNVAKLKIAKRKKCHCCQRSGSRTLIKCFTCQKEFFCLDCIKERYFETQEEVKMACPVCRGVCTCKDCQTNISKYTESKDLLGDENRGEAILCFHYLICMLLPVLKQINKEQNDELEMEAKMKAEKISNLHIKQAEIECNEQKCCNNCEGFILDLHRSCPNCSYNLCLSCCRDIHQGSFHGGNDLSISNYSNKKKTCLSGNQRRTVKKQIKNKQQNSSSTYLDSSLSLSEWKACNFSGISCLPVEFGGCAEGLLDLRSLFPLSWTKELEVTAEEIVCSYEFPDSSDISSSCSLCLGTCEKAKGIEQLQQTAVRENSNDNFLYYPRLTDVRGDNIEHFQKHWSKGQPVIVRNVLKTLSNLSWDPALLFCSYVERSVTVNDKNKGLCEETNCLDWCEVEMGIKQYFMGSLNGQSRSNTCKETLKLKGWLSSKLFQQQFPAHYSEIIHALPLPEYMNPTAGLLNLAARLPQEIPKPDLGPCLYISYGCTEQLVQAGSVVKLYYDSYDTVNILAHTSDVPISVDQLSKIRKLLKKHSTQCQRESSRISDQKAVNEVKGKLSIFDKEIETEGLQNMIGEDMHLRKRVAKVASLDSTNKPCAGNPKERNTVTDTESDSDSEATIHESEALEEDKEFPNKRCKHDAKNLLIDSCSTRWDVFRRQDVPKLKEYINRHSNKFPYTHDFHEPVVHPIFDQRFFLDATHKKRLKEEFDIEPWTFEQHVGEAVIIPAGCPYQIRSPKSCVHVVLDFISPENVTECIRLTDEARLLPDKHKAKVDKLEVKKLALHSISAAIKEIRELTITSSQCK